MIKISVIIPTYNRPDCLNKCIDSLLNQTLNKKEYEIIVVNDGSILNYSLNINAVKKITNFRYYKLKGNKGQPAAMNFGIKKAKGNIINIIDDDCVAYKNWLLESLIFHKKYKNIGAVGGKVINLPKKRIYSKIMNIYFTYECKENKIKEVRDIPSGNFSFKKEIINMIGLFDEKNFLNLPHFDTEFCYRMNRMKNKIYYNPKMNVEHKLHTASFKSFLKRKFRAGLGYHKIKKKWPDYNLIMPTNTIDFIKFLLVPFKEAFVIAKRIEKPIYFIPAYFIVFCSKIAFNLGVLYGMGKNESIIN